MITRRRFLKSTAMAVAGTSVLPFTVHCSRNAEDRNVLFIAIDDLNDWVGCLGGHPQAKTPNIDRLAEKGILFTNAHCAAPLCGPSRAAVFTGIQPWHSDIYTNEFEKLQKIGREHQTIPQALQDAGYVTFGGGKLLHGNIDRYPDIFMNLGPKFKKWAPFTNDEIKYTDKEFSVSADKSIIKHTVDRGPDFNFTLPLNGMPRERRLGSRIIDSFDWGPFPVGDDSMGDFETAEWAIEQLKKGHLKPFFLGVGLYRPHIPLYMPREYYDMFPPEKVQLPEVLQNDLDDIPPVGKDFALKAHTAGSHKNVVEHGQWQNAVSSYLACTAFVDAQIGRVLDALEKSPYSNNTTIYLWSDHGWNLGEKEHWGKFVGWEESTRIPLIVVPAKNMSGKFAMGRTCQKPVSLIDIYATVVDMAGLPPNEHLDSTSLVPLLINPDASWEGNAITTFGIGNHTIRTEEWRYTRYYDGSEELYHVGQDPNEFINLAEKAEYGEIKEELKQEMPAYEDVEYFVSMGYWKAVIRKDRSKTELFSFKDNRAVPEDNNVARQHPEILGKILEYVKKNNIREKYISIPDQA